MLGSRPGSRLGGGASILNNIVNIHKATILQVTGFGYWAVGPAPSGSNWTLFRGAGKGMDIIAIVAIVAVFIVVIIIIADGMASLPLRSPTTRLFALTFAYTGCI